MRLTSRLILSVLALSALCASGQALFAAAAAPQAPAGSPAPAATQSGKGTIIKVDAAAGTIDVRITDAQGKNATTLVLTITAATKITKNKATAKPEDLKPGDIAAFSETPGSDPTAGTALTLDVSKPKGKSKKGAPAGN
jgi:hypothetical protein